MSLSFEMFKLYVVLQIVVGEAGHMIKTMFDSDMG